MTYYVVLTMRIEPNMLRLIQSWKKELDNSGLMGTILTDLSKAYDCLPYDLLKAKLEAYGLFKSSLNLVSLI